MQRGDGWITLRPMSAAVANDRLSLSRLRVTSFVVGLDVLSRDIRDAFEWKGIQMRNS